MYAFRFNRLIILLVLVTFGVQAPVFAQEKEKKPPSQIEERDDDVRAREEWFYQQRAFPLSRIPAGVRLRALEKLEEMRRREGRITLEAARIAPVPGERITASTSQWTPVGPQPTVYSSLPTYLTSGRISALAVDPRDPNVVYLGGAQGGIWKTTDGGATWTSLTDSQPSLAIGSIALAPSNPDIVYVGTGEGNFSSDSYYGAGILKSTDGGQTWTQLPGNTSSTSTGSFLGPFSSGTGGARIGALAVHPQNSQIVLAGVRVFTSDSTAGIYRSTDGGVNWTNVQSGATGTAVVYDVTSPQIVYAALGSTGSDPENGIYKSTDGGITWAKLAGTAPNTLPTANVGRIELAIAPSSTGATATLYAAIQHTGGAGGTFGALLGMWKSSDAGANWTQLTATPDFCTAQCWYDIVLRVHPLDPNVVYAGGSATSSHFMRSLNGGTSWTSLTTGANGIRLHVDQHALAFSTGGSKLYIGNDGGAWSTTDTAISPVNYTNLNSTLSLTQFYPGLSIHPSDDQFGLSGTQDNGTQKYSGTLSWEGVVCGDGGWTAIDSAVPSTFYSTCQRISLWKSNQNGNAGTWFSILTGINTSDRGAFIPPFVIDPVQSQWLYFGTYRVYQTIDGATNWRAISGDLTNNAGVVSTIAVAPSNSDFVYAGTSNSKVHFTGNASAGTFANWTDVSTGLPPRFVSQIAVDPASFATAIVSFSGFSGFLTGDTQGHVFRTTNSGLTWADISGNLPNIPVNDVVIDPDVPDTFYVATDVGVFSTDDGGATWSTLVPGLPRVAVLSLKLRRASRTLRAATHGRGIWDLKLSNFTQTFALSSITPYSAAAGSPALTLTVNGVGFTLNSVVRWNGGDLQTTFINSTQLQATVPAPSLAVSSNALVNVFDPSQSPNTSNGVVFVAMAPSPTMSALTPSLVVAGGAAFTLTVDGANFSATSSVRWNGSFRTTNFISSTRLEANISAADIAQAGYFTVSALSPPPGGGTVSRQFVVTTATAPANDNFVSATLANAAPFSDTVNSFAATTEPMDPTPTCANGSRNKSVWYRVTPAVGASFTADTIGSAYDTILSVYTGSPGSFAAVACDDDGGGGTSSRLALSLTGGVTYHFMVSSFTNFPGESGVTLFNLAPGAAAAGDFTIGVNPNNATVTAGQPAAATLTLAPLPAPFSSAITLSCSGLPALAACSFTPASVTPGANPATSAVSISTTAPSAANPAASSGIPVGPAPPGVFVAWIVLFVFLALFALMAGKRTRKLRLGFYAGCLLLLALISAACGGSSAPPPPRSGTPPGTYAITVTGTAGASTHSVTFSITVR